MSWNSWQFTGIHNNYLKYTLNKYLQVADFHSLILRIESRQKKL